MAPASSTLLKLLTYYNVLHMLHRVTCFSRQVRSPVEHSHTWYGPSMQHFDGDTHKT